MLAVETLSAGWQAAFFAVACAAFLLAGLIRLSAGRPGVAGALVPLGLAAFVFVAFWNALAAT